MRRGTGERESREDLRREEGEQRGTGEGIEREEGQKWDGEKVEVGGHSNLASHDAADKISK